MEFLKPDLDSDTGRALWALKTFTGELHELSLGNLLNAQKD